MKKLLLAVMLGFVSYAASAAPGTVVLIKNVLPCSGIRVTVQFIEYDLNTCVNNGTSPVYPATNGAIYNLNLPSTWAPTPLLPGQTFSAIVCIDCPGLPPFCLAPVGIGPAPTCDPTSIPPVVTPCCGTMGVDALPTSGSPNYTLYIHP